MKIVSCIYISIPYGSIKSLNNEPEDEITDKISIPYGSIKRPP